MWLTGLLLCSPIGVLLGYTLCAALVSYGINWRYALYMQAVMIVPTILTILLTPKKYFDLESAVKQFKQTNRSESENEELLSSHQYFGFSGAPEPIPRATE